MAAAMLKADFKLMNYLIACSLVVIQTSDWKGLLDSMQVLSRCRRPVSSSELLRKPSVSIKDTLGYCLGQEEKGGLQLCSQWLAAETPCFTVVIVNGEHGFGKTELLMQARSILQHDCTILHVKCRAHERGRRGALLQRLLAQLCGYDVWPSMQHIMPMLAAGDTYDQGQVSKR